MSHNQNLVTRGIPGYALLDFGGRRRLEQWGAYTLIRPDPSATGIPTADPTLWKQAHAECILLRNHTYTWKTYRTIPKEWPMHFHDLTFLCKRGNSKQLGIFPEQNIQWDWIRQNIHSEIKSPRVLNLFAYTGCATLVAALFGAHVTHVDAAHTAITWAREVQKTNGLTDIPIRWIKDDCLKFIRREKTRKQRYDGIILDPPAWGHGPSGERWQFATMARILFTAIIPLCTPETWILINSYAAHITAKQLITLLPHRLQKNKSIQAGELQLCAKYGRRTLSTGVYARISPSL